VGGVVWCTVVEVGCDRLYESQKLRNCDDGAVDGEDVPRGVGVLYE
jgi:hypothetical protein